VTDNPSNLGKYVTADIRILAYTSLMRDGYPPFRLDMGPREPEPPAASQSA